MMLHDVKLDLRLEAQNAVSWFSFVHKDALKISTSAAIATCAGVSQQSCDLEQPAGQRWSADRGMHRRPHTDAPDEAGGRRHAPLIWLAQRRDLSTSIWHLRVRSQDKWGLIGLDLSPRRFCGLLRINPAPAVHSGKSIILFCRCIIFSLKDSNGQESQAVDLQKIVLPATRC